MRVLTLVPAWAQEEEPLLVEVQEEVHQAVVAKVPLAEVANLVMVEVEKVVNQQICSFFVVAYPHLYLVGCNTTLEPYHKQNRKMS